MLDKNNLKSKDRIGMCYTSRGSGFRQLSYCPEADFRLLDNFNNETLAAWAQTQGSISSPNSFLGVRKIKNIN